MTYANFYKTSSFLWMVLFFIIFLSLSVSVSAQTSCLGFPSGAAAPSGYGVSWDVFDSARTLLVKTDCPTSGTAITLTVGKGDSAQFVWGTAYSYNGSGWDAHTLTGSNGSAGWFPGSASKSITAPATVSSQSPLYLAAYACTNRSGAWKCGCKDSTCTQPFWQLQSYRGTGSTGGGGGGGISMGTTGFIKVAKSQCVNASADKPFTAGVHTETSGGGAAFSVGGSKPVDLRGVTLQSFQNAYQGPASILEVKNYNNACVVGGRMVGIDDPYKYDWAPNHAWAGSNIGIENGNGTATIENMVLKNNFQDAVTLLGNAPQTLSFSMRGIWIIHNDDDWLQNDNCSSLGTIEDVLVDQTRQGISMRPGADSSASCKNFTFTLRNSLINHVCVKGTDGDGITSDSCPNGTKTGQFFKLSGSSMKNVAVNMENVIFRMESMPVNTCKQIEEQQFNSASTYKNIVIVWDPKDGSTAWPGCNMPAGWSVKQGNEGRTLWNTARQEWLDAHGCNEQTATCTFPNSY